MAGASRRRGRRVTQAIQLEIDPRSFASARSIDYAATQFICMSNETNKGEAQLVTQAITRMLDEGAAGVLVTLMGLPEQERGELRVGARLLAPESSERVGSLGAVELDEEVARRAHHFRQKRGDHRHQSLRSAAALRGSRGRPVNFSRELNLRR